MRTPAASACDVKEENMITRQQLLADKDLLTDKAVGALCGLAIGDSLGDAARMPDNQRDYGFTTDFNKGASWSTDYNLRRGIRPPESGKYNPYHQSDGAAMRSGPIGIYCAGDPEKAAYLAEVDASVSHYADGIWGAQAVAVAVSLGMVDASVEEIWEGVLKTAPEGSWFREALLRADRIVTEHDGRIADAWMPLHNELFSTHRSTVAEALPEVFGCLRMESSSFKSGLLLAANFGRDADTIGAVAEVCR